MIINDSTDPKLYIDPEVYGHTFKRGLVPQLPGVRGAYARPFGDLNMPLIPRDQWAERIREMTADKSRVSDFRRNAYGKPIPSLDQDGVGYCWNHSAVMCAILLRAIANQPYVRLSAFFIGCLIKNYRDEGGWGAAALEFMCQHGVPSVEFWPEKSMKRSNDTPECRANALLHRVTEFYADLSDAVYDRNLSEDQAMTCLLSRRPIIGDFNHWEHSVCLMDAVLMNTLSKVLKKIKDLGSLDFNKSADYKVYADNFGKKGINSWTDGWGDLGEFTLSGSKARLDGGACLAVTDASDA